MMLLHHEAEAKQNTLGSLCCLLRLPEAPNPALTGIGNGWSHSSCTFKKHLFISVLPKLNMFMDLFVIILRVEFCLFDGIWKMKYLGQRRRVQLVHQQRGDVLAVIVRVVFSSTEGTVNSVFVWWADSAALSITPCKPPACLHHAPYSWAQQESRLFSAPWGYQSTHTCMTLHNKFSSLLQIFTLHLSSIFFNPVTSKYFANI